MKNKKLNILFLCSWYPNPDEKSNGIFIKRHAQALSLQHHVTVVFVKSINTILQDITIKNEEENFVEYLHFYPKIISSIPLLNSAQKFLEFKQRYKTAIEQLKQTFDVIHVNTIFPAAIPALYAIKKYPGAKLVITEHWSGYYTEDGSYKGNMLKYYTKKIVSKAGAITVISGKLKDAMLSHKLKGNYQFIHNVVDVSIFKPLKNSVEKMDDILEIIHVSSLVEKEKNISAIINVAAELKKQHKKFHLTIIGENKLEIEAHLKLVSSNNLKNEVSFMGYKTQHEIADELNKADVFLLLSHYEGMPVVVLEALACGLPLISSNVGEVGNMIKSNMGIILQNNSVNECVKHLVNYNRNNFSDPEIMHQYISNSYSPSAVCHSITTIYQTL